uniref:Uncharacterized protein n=1 Tax=Arundo donax TaxID=35708 RepID=A0A0A9A1R6_ARUDO
MVQLITIGRPNRSEIRRAEFQDLNSPFNNIQALIFTNEKNRVILSKRQAANQKNFNGANQASRALVPRRRQRSPQAAPSECMDRSPQAIVSSGSRARLVRAGRLASGPRTSRTGSCAFVAARLTVSRTSVAARSTPTLLQPTAPAATSLRRRRHGYG